VRVEGTIRRRIIAFACVAVFAACSDNVGPNPPPPPPRRPSGLIVSNPIPVGLVASRTGASAFASAAAAAAVDSIAYVSLTPGSVVGGTSATIRRVGSAGSFEIAVFDGGFDPVSVIARAGDSIEVAIKDVGGATIRTIGLRVAAMRAPVVVRTQPPPLKRDLPLNASIVVVFSEPVADSTVTSASIHLLHERDEVPGTPRFIDPTFGMGNLTVEFVPNATLQAATTYQLVVSQLVRDLTGDALAAPDTVEFTTGQSLVGPPASVRTSIDTNLVVPEGTSRQLTATVWDSAGHQLTDTPVTWSTLPDPSPVATVSATGLVRAVSPGVVIVEAKAGQVGDGHQIIVPSPPPASVTIAAVLSNGTDLVPARDTIGVGGYVAMIPKVLDSLGRDMSETIRSVCWFSSNALVANFGGGQDSWCIANPSYVLGYGIGVYGIDAGTVTITATVTVRPSIVFPVDTEVTGTTSVTVVSRLAAVIVSPDTVTLVPSARSKLHTTERDSAGGVLLGYPVAWTSDNPTVATVDDTGLVVGIAPGAATIAATSEGITGRAHIQVVTVAFASVRAGGSFTCGVAIGGTGYCWGDNSFGQLGSLDSTGPSSAPRQVTGGLAFEGLGAGGDHACGLTASHVLYCWGLNNGGQLGLGTSGPETCILGYYSSASCSTKPAAVVGGLAFTLVSAGYDYTCGITTAGAAYCWGNNVGGQLGDGTTISRPSPVPVAGGLTFATLTAGAGHTCGITTAAATYCWGANDNGQLGDGTTTVQTSPVPVQGGLTFASVSAGNDHTCGITTEGATYCWGSNAVGQLGDGTTTSSTGPVPVLGGLAFAALSAGTCGLTTSSLLYCWGANHLGQLGDGTTTNRTSPVSVVGGLTFTSVSAGGSHTCGLTTGGVLYCWGENYRGMLGDGTTVDGVAPVKVLGQP